VREERRLRVFENRVLRRIFGPLMDEVTAEWRKLHNLMICTAHPILCGVKIKKNEMGGACSAYGHGMGTAWARYWHGMGTACYV
jgi:hypothetical protein